MRGGTIRVAFLDVGQGDTIVISLPEQREAVAEALKGALSKRLATRSG